MAMIGGVFVPDVALPSIGAPGARAGARPGFSGAFGGALTQTLGQLRYGIPYQIERALGTVGENDEQFYTQGLRRVAQQAQATAPASIEDVTSGRAGVGSFITENLGAMLPYMAGALVGGAVGARVGGAVGARVRGAIAGGTPQFSASNVARAVEEEGTLTEGAALRSAVVAPLQSAADFAIAPFLPGAGKVLGDMASTQTGGFLRRTATAMLKAGGTEAVTEAAQQVGERFAAGQPLADADAAKEYVSAAVTAFALGGVLGAGGGIRRAPAHQKPAAEVTVDDINTTVDQVLQPPTLALPAPPDVTVDAGGTARVNPATQPTLALPSPEMFARPDGIAAPEGVVMGEDAASQLAQARVAARDPRAPRSEPDIATILAQIEANQPDYDALAAPTPPARPGAQPSTSIAALTAGEQRFGAPQVDLPAGTRTFVDQSFDDLQTVLRTKNAPAEAKAAAQAEVEARRLETIGEAPLTTDNFQQRVDEQKQGLRGGWLSSLEATDPTDLRSKVYTRIFEDQDTSANVAKFAQRIGILDENLQPTAAATAIQAERTAAVQAEAAVAPEALAAPAAPVAPPAPPAGTNQFLSEWSTIKQRAGVQRARGDDIKAVGEPTSLEDAQTRVVNALANPDTGVPTSQVEKLAKELGLVTNDDAMDMTPLGLEAWQRGQRQMLSTAPGLEITARAAQQQGYTGAQASMFDRGVQSVVSGGEVPTLGNLAELGPFEAGRAWARNFTTPPPVPTAAQSQAIRARAAARATNPIELAPGQINQQANNRLIDAADLRTVSDSDVAALRRLARSGIPTDELAEAVSRVTSGQTLFRQPERTPLPPVSERPARGQPRFREMATPDAPGRSDQRAETEDAVRTYDARNLIEMARAEGAMTDARAQKLHELLDQGKRAQVDRLLRDFDPDAKPRAPRLPRPPERVAERQPGEKWSGQADEKLEQELTGKTFDQVVDHMIVNAPSRYHREVMRKVKALVDASTKAGMTFEFRIVQPGDTVPAQLNAEGIRALSVTSFNPPRSTVLMKGSEMGRDFGVNHQLVMHEMLHAATQALVSHGSKKANFGKTQLGKAVQDLTDLGNAIVAHFNARVAEGNLTEFEQAIYDRQINAVANADEMLAWGMTNPEMQRYLQGIEYQPRQSVFAKLVSLLRSLLGLEGSYDTALTELLRVSEQIMNTRGSELGVAVTRRGKTVTRAAEDTSDLDRVLNTRPRPKPIEYGPVQGPSEPHPDDAFMRMPLIGLASGRGMDDREFAKYRRARWREKQLVSPLERNNPDAGVEEVLSAPAFDAAPRRTIADANEATKQAAAVASRFADRIDLRDKSVQARRLGLGFISSNQMVRQFGDRVRGLADWVEANRLRGAVRGRWENIGNEAYQSFEKLERENRKAAEWVGELMALSTEFQVDPDKTFEAHTHLGFTVDDKGKIIPKQGVTWAEINKLKGLHADAVKLRNDLSRGRDGQLKGIQVFNDLRALNEAQNYARMSASLHGLVARDPELSRGVVGADVNPMDVFMQSDLATPAQVREFWHNVLQDQIRAATAYANSQKQGAAEATPSDVRAMQQHLSPLELQIDAITNTISTMRRAPYFHLGRFGDHFGAAVVRQHADGRVDEDAQRKLAAALEENGFGDVRISIGNNSARFSMRFDTVDQAMRFRELALKLQKEDVLGDAPVQAGPRDRKHSWGMVDGLPDYVQRYIQSIETSAMFVPDETMSAADKAAQAERKEEAVRLAVDTWLEMQPDNSISKVLAKRYTRPGYDKNMMRNWAHRFHVGSVSVANVSTSPKFHQAYVEAQAQLNDALDAANQQDPYVVSDVVGEMRQRDARAPINEAADVFDKVRSAAHAYFLGFSPAYGMINITQLGVTALPELAKQHGYSKSFHAMRRASTKVLAVLKAAIDEARELGPKNWADMTISETVLKKAGLSDGETDFLRRMMASGAIDIGTSARALGGVANTGVANTGVANTGERGGKFDTYLKWAGAVGHYYLKWAGAVGLYTETFSRLVTAMAAHDLHGGKPEASTKYATQVVSESMFDYQNWNTARQLGKQGLLGPVTPIVTQFMSYSVQVTEKLYSEAMNSFAKARPGESAAAAADRKRAARRFIAGHLTAVTALAGTLGLPFASAFAAALEKIVDTFDDDDEPFDATAAWRGFLADVLGRDVAEVVARGLPRAAGFDISARAGEQNLLPFTDLLTDKRSWKEAIGAAGERSIGAGPSMIVNLLDGGAMIADGDLAGGLKQFLPTAFKGPAEVYRMTTDGYVDSKGTRLPMTPTASSYLWQLLGFNPSAKAEYSEARGDQQARRSQLTERATQLRRGITRAIITGDTTTARSLIEDAQRFDRDNPAFAVIPSLGESLQRQQQARTRATQLRSPLGVGANDIAGQRLTGYANVDYAQ